MSNGQQLPGQQFSPEDQFVVPFVQQMVDEATATTMVGQAATEIIPQDGAGYQTRVFDLSEIEALNETLAIVRPVTVSIDFPPVLTAVTVTVDTEKGDGIYTSVGQALSTGGTSSMGRSFGGKVRGTATIMPDIQPTIQQVWSRELPATEISLFAGSNPSREEILYRLSRAYTTGQAATFNVSDTITSNGHGFLDTNRVVFSSTATLPAPLVANVRYFVRDAAANTFKVSLTSGGAAVDITTTGTGTITVQRAILEMPIFKPKSHVVTLIGKRGSVELEREFRRTISSGSYARSTEDGESYSAGVSIRTVQLPLALNDTISLTFSPTTVTAEAEVDVALAGSGDFTSGSESGSIPFVVTAKVLPVSLTATSPVALPTSGYYLQSLNAQDYRYGLVKVRAVIFDFAVLQ